MEIMKLAFVSTHEYIIITIIKLLITFYLFLLYDFIMIDIADVTYFVKPGQAMDEEAASRGTTVYLVDKRIDMLPSLLGTSRLFRLK